MLLSLIQRLVQCPSITPNPHDTLQHVMDFLRPLGFESEQVVFHDVTNLYLSRSRSGPHLCFAGHVDVVPPGDLEGWTVPPFAGEICDGFLWGRGVADMKGAIGCFLVALGEFLHEEPDTPLSLSLLLTSDEEGPACHGTKLMVPWMEERGIRPDLCLIGEPTGLGAPGESIKIGRRGSVTGTLRCFGIQGHIAYPHLADNPIPRLLACLNALSQHTFDDGTEAFEPSHLEITSIDVGNPTTNIIPHSATARFGVRFNPLQTGHSIAQTLRDLCLPFGGHHSLDLTVHGEAFLTQDASWIEQLSASISAVSGKRPLLDTTGGTTDGRFLSALCPVLECGLPETTIHQVDERVSLEHIQQLKALYLSFLKTLHRTAARL